MTENNGQWKNWVIGVMGTIIAFLATAGASDFFSLKVAMEEANKAKAAYDVNMEHRITKMEEAYKEINSKLTIIIDQQKDIQADHIYLLKNYKK